jgi:hypothetical protein
MKRLLVWLYLALPVLSFGQANYVKGYVITNSNETLKGYVDYQGRIYTPSAVQFKTGLSEAPQTYTVENCAGYGADDKEYFERFTVNMSVAYTRTSMLAVGLDTSYKRKTAFLKVLQKGKNVTLYSYTDEVKERFFLLRKNDKEPFELFRAQYLNKNSANVLGDFRYRTQLMNVLTATEDAGAYDPLAINVLRYEAQDLLKVVSAINDQKPPKSGVPGIRFFAGAGLNLSKVSYVGNHALAIDEARSTATPAPLITAGLDIFLDPLMRRFLIRLELSAFASKNKVTSTGYSIHTFEQKSLAVTPQFIYSFYNTNDLRIFAGLGAEFNYSTYSKNKPGRLLPPVFEGGEELYERQDITFEPTYFSAVFKAGVVVKKRIELSAGYVMPSNVTNYSAFNVRMQRMTFGVNYLFGAN